MIAGVVDSGQVRQHFVRGLDERALNALQHDVDVAIENGEDVEAVVVAWVAMQEASADV